MTLFGFQRLQNHVVDSSLDLGKGLGGGKRRQLPRRLARLTSEALPRRLECRDVDNHFIDVRVAGSVQISSRILSRTRPRLGTVKKRALLDGSANLGLEELPIAARSLFMEVAADSRSYLCSNVALEPNGHQEAMPAWAKSYGIEIGTPEKRIIVVLPHDFRFQVNRGVVVRAVVLRLARRSGFACSAILFGSAGLARTQLGNRFLCTRHMELNSPPASPNQPGATTGEGVDQAAEQFRFVRVVRLNRGEQRRIDDSALLFGVPPPGPGSQFDVPIFSVRKEPEVDIQLIVRFVSPAEDDSW